MAPSPTRYDLLTARLRGFTRTLPRVKSAEADATGRAWIASRRLRELLPILQLDGPTAERLAGRLRRVTRRLGAVRQMDSLLALLREVERTERRGRLAAARVQDDVHVLAEKARAELFRRKVGNEVRRTSQKLADIAQALSTQGDTQLQTRAIEWALKARVARRGGELKSSITAAGSVYLPGRIRDVWSAVRKLRYAAELAADMTTGVAAADVRALVRAQSLLGNLDDLQTLIDRVRYVQGSLATPDLKAWRDLDGLAIVIENRCRALHARYVRERGTLVAVCDRLTAGAPADRGAKRKVG